VKLRDGLDELRQTVDPEHLDKAFDRAVLVGHSMGGLISKMMIESSGDEIWRLIGRRPFEELQATPEHKKMLRKVAFFEPHPLISRVVFIATPHRGSELGDQFIGRLADRLIRLPLSLRLTYKTLLMQNGPDFFTPEIRRNGLPSSIDELRTDNRLLMTLARLPRKPVPIHSIIGQRDPTLPIDQGSDGVVPYNSSHIDWADSELVVPGDHGCQDTPETIKELRRILFLHIGQK
jgi:pimeloyl-ACP methyl ester carboxylesterase